MKAGITTSIHNRFDIYSTNTETGETKQVAYAENIVLDAMWTRLTARSSYFVNIHYGTGSGTLSKTRTGLFTYLGTKTAVDDLLTRTIPVASWRRKIILNPEDNVGAVLTEIGISYGAVATNLVTHALLLDMNGNQVAITKTALDLLTIYATVYITFSTSMSSIQICGLPNSNPLMNYLVGGTAFPACYFYTGEIGGEGWENTPTIYSNALGTSPVIVWTADTPNKKMVGSTVRFPVESSNGHIKEIGCGSGVNSPIFRILLPATGIYSGMSLEGVSIGTGDGVISEFLIPSKNIDTSTLHVYVNGAETTEFTSVDNLSSGLIPYREYLLGSTSGCHYLPSRIARSCGDVAVAKTFTTTILSYKKVGNSFVARVSPTQLPSGNVTGTALSADGTVLAVSHTTTPFITTYDLVNELWVKRGDVVSPPTGNATGVSLSDDGLVLAVSHDITPFITTYEWTAGNWVKRANPSVLPTGVGNGCSLSAAGTVLAVAHTTTPFITTYEWSAGTWVKRANPTTLPVTIGNGCDLSLNGNVLAVAFTGSPYWCVYDWSGSKWVERTSPVWTTGGYGNRISLSEDGNTVAIPTTAGLYSAQYPVHVYVWSGTAWVEKDMSLTFFYTYTVGRGVALFPDGSQLILGNSHSSDGQCSLQRLECKTLQKKIKFITPPAAGSLLTASYTVKGIHKTIQRVIDCNCTFTFGEPV